MGAPFTLYTWRFNDLDFPLSINLPLALFSVSYSLSLSLTHISFADRPPHLPADPPPLCRSIISPLQGTTPYVLEIIHHWNNIPQAAWWLWAQPVLSPKVHLHQKKTGESFKNTTYPATDRSLGFLQVPVVFWDVWTLRWLTRPPCFLERLTASTGAADVRHEELICVGQEMKEARQKGARETTDL